MTEDAPRVPVASLPTLADRPRPNLQKGPTRLEAKHAEAKNDRKAEARFLQIVRTRDKMRCRCCARKVVVTLTLCPERAEVHHIYGRTGSFRFDDRHALLLCAECHQKVTGKVNLRIFLVQLAKFMLRVVGGPSLIDARNPVQFKEVK